MPVQLSGFSFLMILFLAACSSPDKSGEDPRPDTGIPEIDELTEAIRKTPDDPGLYRQRAQAYADREAYDQAVLDLNRSLALDSLQPETYHLLADVYLDYTNSRMAIETMEKAAARFPGRIPTLLKLVEFQYLLKFYDAAAGTLSRVFALDPRNAEAMFWSGMVFREKGDAARAIRSFQEATEQDPDLIDAWIECGKLLAAEKKPLALRYFETAIHLDSVSEYPRHALAEYYQSIGNYPEALRVYREIVRRNPQYGDALYNSGLIYLEMDSLALAREQFDMAIRVDPTRAMAYFARGNVLELSGHPEAARSDYEQALVLDPSLERARKALEWLPQKPR